MSVSTTFIAPNSPAMYTPSRVSAGEARMAETLASPTANLRILNSLVQGSESPCPSVQIGTPGALLNLGMLIRQGLSFARLEGVSRPVYRAIGAFLNRRGIRTSREAWSAAAVHRLSRARTSAFHPKRTFLFRVRNVRPPRQRPGGSMGRRMPPAILPSASSAADIVTAPLANTRL